MGIRDSLERLRKSTGRAEACGLPMDVVEAFAAKDPQLVTAIEMAEEVWGALSREERELARLPEHELTEKLSHGFLNFYPKETQSPYVPLAAKGPWIVTINGAVIYDTGGYGMIGHGHNPADVLAAMAKPYVMANIMTASFSQRRFVDLLHDHIGMNASQPPYTSYICMNSGSEAMAVATRISDAHAKKMTDEGSRYAGRKIRFLTLSGSFHGRTTRPARVSQSSRQAYEQLASFRSVPESLFVAPNSLDGLRRAFDEAEKNNTYIECVAFEPVMGEGNPGYPISREFYDEARKLTTQHGAFLLIDSIQAGIRTHGVLSIVDYPDFVDCDPPDMEAFSKALNAGQYPLSVLAMNERASTQYAKGTYGNTMTANPRALEVGCAVLRGLTPALEENITSAGRYLLVEFERLQNLMPEIITKVQGTGLLLSVHIKESVLVVGPLGVETLMRKNGVNVIHGGKNALRYTPQFRISREEMDLIVKTTADCIQQAISHTKT